jgi:lipid II:glycine glycyltransferase (peptidoglycan interpeptide bridge formation enzyme)
MIRVRPATDADQPAWQALLGEASAGDFLHDWVWAEVAAFDGQPQRRFVAEEGGALVALAAAQVRRLPLGRSFWYVPHGPVLDYADPRAGERLRAVAIGLREAARNDRALAVKLEPRTEAGSADALFARLRHDPHTLQVGQTRLVELADDETLLAGFDKDTRYAVRRAEREGVVVTHTEELAELRAIDELHALVLEGRQSFYLFSGSRREAPGEPKHYASYALQWAMMRLARERGSRLHDLWGIAPEEAGPEHPWHGVGLFKKGFGGRAVTWSGSWDVVVDRNAYRLREAVFVARAAASGAVRRLRR